jgi:hypothetical protein
MTRENGEVAAPPTTPVTFAAVAPNPAGTVAARGRGHSDIGRWLDVRVIAAGLVVVAVRFWFAVDRRVFHVVADEPGQLAMARWLSGGTRWNMFDHSTWRPGYSLVLAPAFWLVDTGEGAVRAALTLNAVLAGISAMILTRLLWRWTASWTPSSTPSATATSTTGDGSRTLGPWSCVGIATVVAVAPAAIATSAYTWAEAMVTATFLATVWWAQRFADSGRTGHALAATVAAAAAITTHGRSLALLPTVVVVGAAVLLLRGRRFGAVAVVGYGAALGAVSIAFTRWVHDAVWDDPSEINGTGSVIERLDAPSALAESFIGQSWYQLVASLGMVGVGVGVVAVALARPTGRLDRRSAAVLTVLTGPLVLTSVTFMADRDRADQLVYGRYVDAVVWPLAAIGLATVVRLLTDRSPVGNRAPGHRLVLVVAATCAVSGLVVAWRHGDQLAGDVGLRMMVPGLLPYIGSEDGVPVLTITVVASAAVAAIAATVRTGRSLGRGGVAVATVALGLLLAWAGVRVHDAQAVALNTWAIGDDVARIDELVPDGEPIGVVIVPDSERPRVPYAQQRQRYQIYQLYLPDRELVWERTPHRPGTTYLLAPAGYPPLVDAGATIRWGDPAVRVALWELPHDRRAPDVVHDLPSPG